ncbi:MAG: hypothetical protein AB1489_24450 [Acidobacteriota bacterium]
MKRGLKVRHESAPSRCEICHQSDRLDPETGECARCRNVELPPLPTFANGHEEEHPNGLIIPFSRMKAARTITALLALAFITPVIGPFGTIFFVGLCCFLAGAQRVLADRELTGRPKLDLILNLLLMNIGLVGCCFGGVYFLRMVLRSI